MKGVIQFIERPDEPQHKHKWNKWPDKWPDDDEQVCLIMAQGHGALIPDTAIFTSTNAVTGESERHWFGWEDEDVLYWMPIPPIPESEDQMADDKFETWWEYASHGHGMMPTDKAVARSVWNKCYEVCSDEIGWLKNEISLRSVQLREKQIELGNAQYVISMLHERERNLENQLIAQQDFNGKLANSNIGGLNGA
jgi:hypothetical protein